MTNKKFKLTAAAVALAACAAAQPVSASAADELPDAFPEQDAVVQPKKAPAADTAEINDTVSPSAADAAQDTTPGDDSDPAEEPQPALPVLGPKDTIAYPPAETVQNPDGSTTETTEGPVTDGETGKDKGTADKTETRTDESSTTYDPAGTVVDKTTTENPDGSVTETTTTVSQGTTTTTTTVEGSASSSTSKTETTPKDELDADEELKDITVDWSTGKGAEVGGNYIVTGESELSEDGNSRQLTLTKVTHETGSMEGQDIAKLIDAGYVDNGDGTYTLTKTITDANGRQQQTTVTVDSSTASRTVTTTLIVKVEKSTQHGREDVKQDYTYPPETTLTDGAGNSYTLHIAELLADPTAQRSPDGKTITVQKGRKTYTLMLGDETTAGQAELSNQDLAALMGGEEKGYTVGKDGALYLTKDGETCKLDADQTALLRKQMKVHVKVENDKGTLGSQQLAQVSNMLQSMAAAAERVFEFLNEPEEDQLADPARRADPASIDGQVTFDHVKFGYVPEKTIIHDFSCTVNPGEKVAIVGPTGAGKTTMVKLLMRFYDVDSGSITLNGHDIRDFDRSALREGFGMVLQDTWLFKGTIMENIRYGRLDATDEEVIAAAKAANADHFIRTLPGGYQMELNEDASNVSQGQKQLLTIARAILADNRILILDEATSSVDTRTEQRIQTAMDNLMRGRTSFVIAHRLSTIKDADLILVMRDGDIVEQGTHDQLLEAGGFYADLYNSQFEDVVD